MTNLSKVKSPSLNTRKGRQILLKNKIEEINSRLKELGVSDMKYKCSGGISNPETTQNTVKITTSTDVNVLIRMLASYKNMLNTHKEICKTTKLDLPPLLNSQSINVKDIVSDLEMRIVYVVNMNEINKLNQIKSELLPFLDEETKFVNALQRVDSLLKS